MKPLVPSAGQYRLFGFGEVPKLDPTDEIKDLESLETVVSGMRSDGLKMPQLGESYAAGKIKPEAPKVASEGLSKQDVRDISGSIAKGTEKAVAGAMALEQARVEAKRAAELQKGKSLLETQMAGTAGQVGALGNYVANLRAALGR